MLQQGRNFRRSSAAGAHLWYSKLLFILATGVKSSLPAVQYKTVSSKEPSEWSTDGWIGKRLSFRLSGAFGVTRYQSSHILRPVSWCWSDFWLVRILNICFSLFVFLSADSFWWHQTNRKAAIVLFLMHLLKTGWNQIKYIRKYAVVHAEVFCFSVALFGMSKKLHWQMVHFRLREKLQVKKLNFLALFLICSRFIRK